MDPLRFAFSLLALCASGSGTIGCAAHPVGDRAARPNDARTELARLRGDYDRLRQRVEALETTAAAGRSSPGDSSSRPAIREPRHPLLDVVVLRPDQDMVPEGGSGRGEKSFEDEPSAKTAHVDAGPLYARGASEFAAKRYDSAIGALTEFLVRSPEHPAAERALFLLGECFLAKEDWARASEQFDGLLARFPRSKKAPDAMARLAYSFQRRGDRTRSQDLLTCLRTTFPGSSAARSAPKE